MSDFDYENDYDGGDAVTSEFSGPGQASSAVKRRRDIEKENGEEMTTEFILKCI